MQEITFRTAKKQEIVDITDRISSIVSDSKVQEGICLVYAGHATGAIIINENYDPNVMLDIIHCLDKLIPQGIWLHDKVDKNAAAHIKAAIVGPSETVPIRNNSLMLGQWQHICFCEFDGPRQRTVTVALKNAL